MEAGDETRKFSHFFTFSPTVGIRYRATAQLVLVRVRLFPWPAILSVSCIHRLQKRPIFSPSFLSSSLSLSSAIAATLLRPFHSFLFCLPRFPLPHSISQPFGHKKYFYAFLEIFFLPSVRLSCTQFSVAPFLSTPSPPYYSTGGQQEWREVWFKRA